MYTLLVRRLVYDNVLTRRTVIAKQLNFLKFYSNCTYSVMFITLLCAHIHIYMRLNKLYKYHQQDKTIMRDIKKLKIFINKHNYKVT